MVKMTKTKAILAIAFVAIVAMWSVRAYQLNRQWAKDTEQTTEEDWTVLQGPNKKGRTPYFHDTMKLDQIDKQLDRLLTTDDTTYTIMGVETEGTYWWFCDGGWIKIGPPCPFEELTVEVDPKESSCVNTLRKAP